MAVHPIVRTLPADSTTWRPLTHAFGPGRLNGIGVAQTQEEISYVRITLDDEVVVSDKLGSSSAYANCGNDGMTLDLPFTEELKIEIRDGHYGRPQTRFWASYVLGRASSNG